MLFQLCSMHVLNLISNKIKHITTHSTLAQRRQNETPSVITERLPYYNTKAWLLGVNLAI